MVRKSMDKGKRTQRGNVGPASIFDQRQIAEFKEAFSKIDQDEDGFIGRDDLKKTLIQLGQPSSDADVESMMCDIPGTLNFTVFLTLYSEKMRGTDGESEILKAFSALQGSDSTQKIDVEYLREALTTMGDRLSQDEFDTMLANSNCAEDRVFNSKAWVRALKYGS